MRYVNDRGFEFDSELEAIESVEEMMDTDDYAEELAYLIGWLEIIQWALAQPQFCEDYGWALQAAREGYYQSHYSMIDDEEDEEEVGE